MGPDIRFSFVHRNAETLYTLPYTNLYRFLLLEYLPHIVFFIYNFLGIKNLSFIFIS